MHFLRSGAVAEGAPPEVASSTTHNLPDWSSDWSARLAPPAKARAWYSVVLSSVRDTCLAREQGASDLRNAAAPWMMP